MPTTIRLERNGPGVHRGEMSTAHGPPERGRYARPTVRLKADTTYLCGAAYSSRTTIIGSTRLATRAGR
jgi:hypothetical protein